MKGIRRNSMIGALAVILLLAGGCGSTKQAPKDMEDNYRTYYEVFVSSFFDSDGDGIGDLKGLTQNLDYINDGKGNGKEGLGCDGIWLTPIMPSPSYHKYDVTDYYAIDPEFGSMAEFEAFMEECTKRGVKVILDLVINHSSSEHPWFQEASQYLVSLGNKEPILEECPYVDYYHFSREKKEGYHPLPGSEIWYYEGRFYEGMPDLNLQNESLKAEIEKIVQFWTEKGVGGFRLDAAKEYVTGVDSANIEILSWFNRIAKERNPNAYIVAEIWTDANTYAKYYDSGIDSIFNFEFANSNGVIANTVKGSIPAASFSKSLENIETLFGSNNPDYIDAPFYTNHDMGRSAGYYAGENSESQTKLAGALNLLMSGSAFVYYGEELGMKGSGKDENKRAPMYFFEDLNAEGMCKGAEAMDSVKMKYGSLEQQKKEPYSLYHYFREAISLRNKYPELIKGNVKSIEALSDDTIAAFSKSYEEKEAHVICNVSSQEREISVESIGEKLRISDGLYVNGKKAELVDGKLTLPPYGVVILQEKDGK